MPRTEPFDVRDVSGWARVGAETRGGGEHDWRRDPGTGARWLFKPVTVKDGRVYGDDWAEKVAAEIATLLRVPCARVELAVSDGRRGVISLDLRRSGWDMYGGADLLGGLVPGYQPKVAGRSGHNLDNVELLLARREPPPECDLPEFLGAFGVFAGYLALDAVIANQDRHEDNWSILRPPGAAPDALAGSYDHGSSLGFNIADDDRDRRLREGTVEQWAARGRVTRFERVPGEPRQTLTAFARDALRRAGSQAHEFWLDAVSALSAADVHRVVAQVPTMSPPARTFVEQLVTINGRRLLDGV